MIKKLFAITLLLTLTTVSIMAPASAAPRQAKTPPTYGIDISYPQCGKRVPTDQAFGIVGINGGKASNFNTCLQEQLLWASKSSGEAAGQDAMQVYLNTGNPGEVQDQMDPASPWPGDDGNIYNNYYGTCTGDNDEACSWQYGWNKAAASVDYFRTQLPATIVERDPSAYFFWLDVENTNSWQGEELNTPSSEQYQRNVVALEGWVDYLRSVGIEKIGIYSTTYQWSRITGQQVLDNPKFNGIPTWYALGSTTLSNAQKACTTQAALTANSRISITQYVSKNLDYNFSCPL